MPKAINVTITVPIVIAVGGLLVISIPSILPDIEKETPFLYLFGGLYLLCAGLYFVLREDHRIAVCYLGIFLTSAYLAWSAVMAGVAGIPVLFMAMFVPVILYPLMTLAKLDGDEVAAIAGEDQAAIAEDDIAVAAVENEPGGVVAEDDGDSTGGEGEVDAATEEEQAD